MIGKFGLSADIGRLKPCSFFVFIYGLKPIAVDEIEKLNSFYDLRFLKRWKVHKSEIVNPCSIFLFP